MEDCWPESRPQLLSRSGTEAPRPVVGRGGAGRSAQGGVGRWVASKGRRPGRGGTGGRRAAADASAGSRGAGPTAGKTSATTLFSTASVGSTPPSARRGSQASIVATVRGSRLSFGQGRHLRSGGQGKEIPRTDGRPGSREVDPRRRARRVGSARDAGADECRAPGRRLGERGGGHEDGILLRPLRRRDSSEARDAFLKHGKDNLKDSLVSSAQEGVPGGWGRFWGPRSRRNGPSGPPGGAPSAPRASVEKGGWLRVSWRRLRGDRAAPPSSAPGPGRALAPPAPDLLPQSPLSDGPRPPASESPRPSGSAGSECDRLGGLESLDLLKGGHPSQGGPGCPTLSREYVLYPWCFRDPSVSKLEPRGVTSRSYPSSDPHYHSQKHPKKPFSRSTTPPPPLYKLLSLNSFWTPMRVVLLRKSVLVGLRPLASRQ